MASRSQIRSVDEAHLYLAHNTHTLFAPLLLLRLSIIPGDTQAVDESLPMTYCQIMLTGDQGAGKPGDALVVLGMCIFLHCITIFLCNGPIYICSANGPEVLDFIMN